MSGWILFALFLVVGIGMLLAGIVYMNREKSDPESVKVYRSIALIGLAITAAAIAWKFLLG